MKKLVSVSKFAVFFQPILAVSNSLMLGFHAEYESGEIRIQEEELADAQWFPFDQLPNPLP